MHRTTTPPPLTADQAERRLVLLTATRWFPVGIVFGLTVLLPLSRGLSLTQVGLLLSIQGFVVLGLELPTGGLADSLGRRPLLLLSGVLAVLSTVLILFAETFWMFALGMVAQGIFRALDSGPLEAWFVDTANAHDQEHPIERGLSRASMTLGVVIAVGAMIGGALVAWHPLGEWSALALPFGVTTVLYAAHTLLLATVVREAPRTTTDRCRHLQMLDALQQAPRTVMLGLQLLRSSTVLRALVLVEVFWSVAMIAFETLTPVQLADDLGGEDAAAALFGPASAAAWGLFAVGALLAGITSKRFGVARTAIASRILNGLFVIAMGLAAGPVGLIVGYWLAYLTHGSAGPMHNALLHREATPENRAVVLSMNSMVSGGSYSLGLLILTPLAAAASPGFALAVAGGFSVIGALLYIPSRRRERETVLVQSSV
ncbi:MFS transporter [Arthrobacter sp. GMC3]|uniref:MFS transporter n=1 Tax=Arthrobacter sp. GMC3 TaxID=2058894 RepID=UPI000CE3C527|nr:MFS transporter [Arthrobacter sp. GMC3]